jgi:four helix bundle protein
MQDFRNLRVWQTARRLTRIVYEVTADVPQAEEFGIRSQLRRASVSVCSNIAEECGRSGDRELRHFLTVAMGSACELECVLIVATELSLIAGDALDRALPVLVETKKMLTSLINRLTPMARGRGDQQAVKPAKC